MFVPANPWHYQLNYFNITDILKLLQFGTYRNRHLDFAKFHMSSEHYVMPVWQWPRRETCRDDRRHVAGDGDMENMEMLEQVLSLWVWCLLLPSVGQFWHRLNHIRRGPLLGPSIRCAFSHKCLLPILGNIILHRCQNYQTLQVSAAVMMMLSSAGASSPHSRRRHNVTASPPGPYTSLFSGVHISSIVISHI